MCGCSRSVCPPCQTSELIVGAPAECDDFGTNADGTKNGEFCHFCYRDGHFTDEGVTMEQKIDKLVDIAVAKMKIPKEQARAQASEIIPTLKRWRSK